MSLLPRIDVPFFFIQAFQSWLNGAFFAYTAYVYWYLKDDLEQDGKTVFTVLDLIHYPIQVFMRSFIISIKYGYYSKEHFSIFKQIYNTKFLSMVDLLVSSVLEKDVEILKDRMMYAIN